MELLDFYSKHILFNFLSFGTLLVTIFTSLFAYFFLTLRNKSKSTLHLGIAFFFLSLFNLGYFLAALLYHPIAAYHRWFTGCFILPSILHFGQFFLKYPTDLNPKNSNRILFSMWAVSIISAILFIYNTISVDRKFHFTGHYWDFDAEQISKSLGILIAIYSIISFLIIPIWKVYKIKSKERKTIIQLAIASLIAAITPNITNIMSRDGAIERSAYLLSLTLFFVIGFFIISVVYVNSTKDRTTFMAKIVGLTMVTLLIIMQASTFYSMKDKDVDYDSLRVENVFRIIEGGDKYKDTKYFIQYKLETQILEKKDYPETTNLDLPMVEVDFKNTVIYDEIKELAETNFKQSLINYLNTTHSYFEGYKGSILYFIEKNDKLNDIELKNKIFSHFDSIDQSSFVHRNKISLLDKNQFCNQFISYIQTSSLTHFKNAIEKNLKNCKWKEKEITNLELRQEVLKYLRSFNPSFSRTYRRSLDDYTKQKHFLSYIYFDKYTRTLSEVGYSYQGYRQYLHSAAFTQQIILIVVVFVVIVLYPLFFKGSLINPLWELVTALERVNIGNLDVEVPVKVNDEIGFLSESFNSMVISIRYARSELKIHADTLEQKVKDRTKQVEEQMEEVNKLKVQQDGDYFLTSLLAKPLYMNANKSEFVKTDFLIKQKKKFEFKNKEVEIGGDICITGNLRLGTKENFKRFTVAMNGDAMGKSMQGAGGSIVMGVVMNSIMARSAAKDWILDKSPETWLTDVYYEIHRVFKAFNGSMVISCTVLLICDESGEVYYFNAEHPFSVLYRNGKAQFIEDKLNLRKLGLDSEIPFQVFKTELQPGDVIIIASDGRDDIDITPNEPVRTINEDESLFLKHVIQGEGDVYKIYECLTQFGEFIDDLSILRIGYKEAEVKNVTVSLEPAIVEEEYETYDEVYDLDKIYEDSKELIRLEKNSEALDILQKAFFASKENQNHAKINKLYGLLSFKARDYETAVYVIRKYLEQDESFYDFWYYLAIAEKKLGNYEKALDSSEKLKQLSPKHTLNLLNLADLKRILGYSDSAITLTRQVLELEPENQSAKRLLNILEANQNT